MKLSIGWEQAVYVLLIFESTIRTWRDDLYCFK